MTIINILVWITAIISIASVIAAITPTPKDDHWFSHLYKIIDTPDVDEAWTTKRVKKTSKK